MVRVKVSTTPQQDVRVALELQLFQHFIEDVVFLQTLDFLNIQNPVKLQIESMKIN